LHRSYRSSLLASLSLSLCLSLAVTGCAADTDESDESTASDLSGTRGKVDVASSSVGIIYTDKAGFSLYTFDNDTTSESTCYDQCAARWPAVLVTSSYGIRAPFGVTTRTDGKKQLTVDGHPLYRFANDLAPGDVKGEGIGGVWHLARPAAAQVVTSSAGKIYANGLALSLYVFDNDTTSESTCYDACAGRWPALLVPSEKGIEAPFGVTTRTDGKKQVTLGGRPLYTFFNDVARGDVKGDGIGGVWHLARPIPPAKEVSSSKGKIFANLAGLSLYTFDNDTTRASTCFDACAERWPALTVPSADGIEAPFGLTTRPDGKKQVTLNGDPLYTFFNDAAPGDVKGDGIGGVWHLARPSAPPSPY